MNTNTLDPIVDVEIFGILIKIVDLKRYNISTYIEKVGEEFYICVKHNGIVKIRSKISLHIDSSGRKCIKVSTGPGFAVFVNNKRITGDFCKMYDGAQIMVWLYRNTQRSLIIINPG